MKNNMKKMMGIIETSINDASVKSQCLGYVLAIPSIIHSWNIGKKYKNGEIGKIKMIGLIYLWSTIAGLTAAIVTYLSYIHFDRNNKEKEDLKETIDLLKESSKPWGDKLGDEIDAEEVLKF